MELKPKCQVHTIEHDDNWVATLTLEKIEYKKNKKFTTSTYRFVKHTSLTILICTFGTVNKTVTEYMVINTSISALPIGSWTCETFHSICCGWAFYVHSIDVVFELNRIRIGNGNGQRRGKESEVKSRMSKILNEISK